VVSHAYNHIVGAEYNGRSSRRAGINTCLYGKRDAATIGVNKDGVSVEKMSRTNGNGR
jgi:hypothetical protein